MKVYFKSGEGIKEPVDVNGNTIKPGDKLTHDYFTEDFPKFFNDFYSDWPAEKVHEVAHQASVIVKINDKGMYYGEGIDKQLYMHDFRFKYTKKVLD